jgi:hypothetical protein
MERGPNQMPGHMSTKDTLMICSKEGQRAYAECILLYPQVVCGLPAAQAFRECMKVYEEKVRKTITGNSRERPL